MNIRVISVAFLFLISLTSMGMKRKNPYSEEEKDVPSTRLIEESGYGTESASEYERKLERMAKITQIINESAGLVLVTYPSEGGSYYLLQQILHKKGAGGKDIFKRTIGLEVNDYITVAVQGRIYIIKYLLDKNTFRVEVISAATTTPKNFQDWPAYGRSMAIIIDERGNIKIEAAKT